MRACGAVNFFFLDKKDMAVLCKYKKDWFPFLFGFEEPTGSLAAYLQSQAQFSFDPASGALKSLVNGRVWQTGQFSTPTLKVFVVNDVALPRNLANFIPFCLVAVVCCFVFLYVTTNTIAIICLTSRSSPGKSRAAFVCVLATCPSKYSLSMLLF